MARKVLLTILLAAVTFAHPMGNFSVSHYARLTPAGDHLLILYSLDLAEIPTFELMRDAAADSSHADIEKRAKEQMKTWVRGLKLIANGREAKPVIERTEAWVTDGAGGMPVVRVAAHLSVATPWPDVKLEYHDTNFDGRAGWKEIVLPGGKDHSQALTDYPTEATVAPPQDSKASLAWKGPSAPPPLVSKQMPPPVKESPVVAAPAPAAGGPQQQAAGTVQRGDFLSTLLSKKEIPFALALMGFGAAFVLGSLHAMSPGHGKTIVAAYLVGSRGTLRHAAFLGGMVTFTHTVSVFLLGVATLFLSQYILPEKIVPWLGAISGLSIVLIGVSLFRKRLAALRGNHAHDHTHTHTHAHGPHHHHEHEHGDGDHHRHHHVPEGEVSLAGLVALGVSGGLVPCPSALVLLLSAIALGRTGYGLLLLIAFSLGLALVLMGIGVLVLFAKNLVPASSRITASPAFRLLPVVSAAIIVCVGIVMTGASIGVFKPIG